MVQITMANKLKLIIFDIDETLFKTNASIQVINNGNIVKLLTNTEYNSHKLSDNESYDFSEFRNSEKFHNESVPIGDMIEQVKSSIKEGSDVYFVTARDDFNNKELFLDTFINQGIDIDKIRVERAGKINDINVSATKKKIIIRNILKTKQYDSVIFFDDFWGNLQEFYSLKSEFPNTEFKGILV